MGEAEVDDDAARARFYACRKPKVKRPAWAGGNAAPLLRAPPTGFREEWRGFAASQGASSGRHRTAAGAAAEMLLALPVQCPACGVAQCSGREATAMFTLAY